MFGGNILTSNLGSSIRPAFGGLGWTQGVENGKPTIRNLGPTFLFDFYVHQSPIFFHRLATIHNTAYIHRTIGIGRLCSCIDGLKVVDALTVRNVVSRYLILKMFMPNEL